MGFLKPGSNLSPVKLLSQEKPMMKELPEQQESKNEKKQQPESASFSITLERVQDYEFRVKFDKAQFQELILDEPSPLGRDTAPNASRLLAAAVGNCLSTSLAFCVQKSRVKLLALNTRVDVKYARSEKGRLRIGKIEVEIEPKFVQADLEKAKRCLELFEDYCTVTQSVRAGIPISVSIKTP
jgi:uncharacterized OsmC-like protein